MSIPFIPCSKSSISKEDIQAVKKSFEENSASESRLVEKFEETIAYYCGAQYAVAFSSGTAAKMATYFAAGLTRSDWIITGPNNCITSVGPAVHTGTQIHLIDTDPKTGHMDLNLLEDKLKLRSTRGRPFLIACHFAGIPLDMQSIDRIICQPETIVIEDASYALGSCYPDGKKVGGCAFSQMTLFSFSTDKLVTTGEGGLVTTNDFCLSQRLKLYRNNGIPGNHLNKTSEPWFHECQAITGNFHLTHFQAALGLSQFKRMNELIKQRQQLMHRYRENLKPQDPPIVSLLAEEHNGCTAWQLCVAQIDFESVKADKFAMVKVLKDKGIETNVHFSPLYMQPLLGPLLSWEDEYPQNDLYSARALSLPLYHDLNFEDIDRICRELKSVLGVNHHAHLH